jgi:chromosome segregation ATPase
MFAGESEAEISLIAIQRMMEDEVSPLLEQIKGLEEQLLQEQRQNTYLQGRIKDADAKSDQLTAEVTQLRTDLADAEQKRDAAARELSDAQAKIEQLQSWNDDLQKQIAVGVSGAIRVIDPEEKARREAEEKAAAERMRIEKYTVYDVKPDNELNPRKYFAKRAYDNEPVEFLAFAKNAYTILNDESEVLQFRTEHQPESVAQDNTDVAEPAQPVQTADNVGEQFQGEAEVPPVLPDVQAPTVDREVASEAGTDVVSREEVDARFKRIEEHLGLKSWLYDGEVA